MKKKLVFCLVFLVCFTPILATYAIETDVAEPNNEVEMSLEEAAIMDEESVATEEENFNITKTGDTDITNEMENQTVDLTLPDSFYGQSSTDNEPAAEPQDTNTGIQNWRSWNNRSATWAFLINTEDVLFPGALNVVNNNFSHYTVNWNTGVDTVRQVSSFIRIDPPADYYLAYNIYGVRMAYMKLGGGLVATTQDTNVMVSPNWIWRKEVWTGNANFNQEWAIESKGVVDLSNNCQPMTLWNTNKYYSRQGSVWV